MDTCWARLPNFLNHSGQDCQLAFPYLHQSETIWVVRVTSRGIYILTTGPLKYTNTKATLNGPFIFGISSSGGATGQQKKDRKCDGIRKISLPPGLIVAAVAASHAYFFPVPKPGMSRASNFRYLTQKMTLKRTQRRARLRLPEQNYSRSFYCWRTSTGSIGRAGVGLLRLQRRARAAVHGPCRPLQS